MKAPFALLIAFVTGCHSGAPRGTEAPDDPIVGTWRAEALETAIVVFGAAGEYRAVGIAIAGISLGRWQRYSQTDIVLDGEGSPALTVMAEFDVRRDRVVLSWARLIAVMDLPLPSPSEVVLVRAFDLGGVDAGSAGGAVPASPGTQ